MNTTPSTIPEILAFPCNSASDYPAFQEISKYIGSLLYLVPGLLFHIFILKTILGNERKMWKESSFFQLYAMDCVASIFALLVDIFLGRLFLYVSPLCPIVIPFFYTPSIILKTWYYISIHARFSKCVAQIFLVLNRMSCIIVPTEYSQIWKKGTPWAISLIAFLPITATWNVILSRVYAWPLYGGFIGNYIRYVQWAALSMFQSIYILTALAVTVVCSSVTLYKLIFLPDRIKSAERSLCLTSIYISITFLAVAVTQLLYVFCPVCRAEPILFILNLLAFDCFTVGSSVIMIIINTKLRESLLEMMGIKRKENLVRVSQTNASFS